MEFSHFYHFLIIFRKVFWTSCQRCFLENWFIPLKRFFSWKLRPISKGFSAEMEFHIKDFLCKTCVNINPKLDKASPIFATLHLNGVGARNYYWEEPEMKWVDFDSHYEFLASRLFTIIHITIFDCLHVINIIESLKQLKQLTVPIFDNLKGQFEKEMVYLCSSFWKTRWPPTAAPRCL